MKQTIRLTESELKHLIKESVKRVLRENTGVESNDNDFGYHVILYRINSSGGAVGYDAETFQDKNTALQYARESVKKANFPIVAECGEISEDSEPYQETINGKRVVFQQMLPSDIGWYYTIANITQNNNFEKIDEYIEDSYFDGLEESVTRAIRKLLR